MNEIAGVPDRMARITEKSGYAYVDFHKDVANLDVFDVAGPAYRAESRMLFGAEEAEYSGETNLISHLSLRAKESFSVGFEFPDERKKIELLHWEVLRGYACRVKIIDAETNLGSIKLIPEKAFDHVAGFDRFFLSNPTYRVEGLTPLLLSDPHARLDWLKIRGQIHVFEPQEIGMQLHREFNNRIKQSVKQAVKQQKGVQQNLKQEIRQVNHLLHYHGSSPIRALSLWWNRKRLTDLRKSQLEKVVPDNSASGKPDHD